MHQAALAAEATTHWETLRECIPVVAGLIAGDQFVRAAGVIEGMPDRQLASFLSFLTPDQEVCNLDFGGFRPHSSTILMVIEIGRLRTRPKLRGRGRVSTRPYAIRLLARLVMDCRG